LIRRSLRWRLLAGAAVAISVALLVTWVLMTWLFERHLERRLAAELEHDGLRVVAGLMLTASHELEVREPPTDDRFQTPASGLYWQATAGDSAVHSPSLWDQVLPPSPAAPSNAWQTRIDRGPFEPRLVLQERRVVLSAGTTPILVQIGQDASVIRTASTEFGRELGIFLVVLWLVLSAAAWLQVGLGLRPLSQLLGELARMRHSPAERLAENALHEVRPLTDAINALAEAREQDVDRARRRSADLAHGLKTPLSALAAQSRRARAEGAVEAAEGLDRAIVAARTAIEAELARTRIASIRRIPGVYCVASTVAEQLVAVLERTEVGESRIFEIAIAPELRVPLAQEDLTELLGAVAENATRYAKRIVRLSGHPDGDRTVLMVEDDGPGIESGATNTAFLRGARLDESGGQGLGLAIAREIVEATGGSIEMSRSPIGGLKVSMSWPTIN